MNNLKRDLTLVTKAAVCLVFLLVLGGPDTAFADELLGAYVGPKLGWGRANMEMVQYSSDRPPRAVSFTDNGLSYSLFGGYGITPTWGIEGALGNLGKYATGNNSGTLTESVELPFFRLR